MRLKEIFALIPKAKIFADIGCDHGQLCKMVLSAHLADRIIATDISEACLKKARALLGEKVEYMLGDGLEPLGDIVPDVTVISGMGGNTILHILGERLLPMLIISPQNDVYKVRSSLIESGYMIVEDKIVTENEKFYPIIKLVPGKMQLDELQKTFGAFFYRSDKVLLEKLSRDKEKLLSYKQTEQNKYKLGLISQAEDIIKKYQLKEIVNE